MRRDYEKGKRKDILSDILKEKFVLSKGQEIFYTILTYCQTSVILQIEQKRQGQGMREFTTASSFLYEYNRRWQLWLREIIRKFWNR